MTTYCDDKVAKWWKTAREVKWSSCWSWVLILALFVCAFFPNVAAANPTDGGIWLQEAKTPIAEEGHRFYYNVLLPIIIGIVVFVLCLLIYILVRFNARRNPTPSDTHHNTLLEVIWTAIPVLILVVIAIPSFKLLYNQYEQPEADLVVKVVGHQWYWSYEYPDDGDFAFDSYLLSKSEAKKKGEPYLLAVDNPMVVPAGANVKLLVTSTDVIHAWTIPSFFVKMDAVPGRNNETWFKAPDEVGIYYGQCSELCGKDHGYMPIAVKVVSKEDFEGWIKSNT